MVAFSLCGETFSGDSAREAVGPIDYRRTGDPDAVKDRDNVAGKMTPAQIEEAKGLVAAWKPTTGQ